jgi:hypothetical protein
VEDPEQVGPARFERAHGNESAGARQTPQIADLLRASESAVDPNNQNN